MEILLVEDDPELRRATEEMLKDLGHRVYTASDGIEALEHRAALTADLLLTDLAMPRLDGHGLIQKLRDRRPELRVLVVSSQYTSHEAAAFLPKPFTPEELDEALQRALKRPISAVPATSPLTSPERSRQLSFAPGAWIALAVAAMLAIFWLPEDVFRRPPELPVPPAVTVERGGALELLEPVGPLAELPRRFAWQVIAPAAFYSLRLEAVDGHVLWQITTDSAGIDRPDEMYDFLQPSVSYYWQVEAFDSAERRVAWSPRTRFRMILPLTVDPVEPP